MPQVLIDLTQNEVSRLHAEAHRRSTTFARVAADILAHCLDYAIAVDAMRPPVYDPLGRGDGYPTGGDA